MSGSPGFADGGPEKSALVGYECTAAFDLFMHRLLIARNIDDASGRGMNSSSMQSRPDDSGSPTLRRSLRRSRLYRRGQGVERRCVIPARPIGSPEVPIRETWPRRVRCAPDKYRECNFRERRILGVMAPQFADMMSASQDERMCRGASENLGLSEALLLMAPAVVGDTLYSGDAMSATINAPLDWVEAVGNLHFPVKADRRLQELMDRNNDDLLDSVERDELEALVELSEQMSLVRGEAIRILGKQL